MEYRMAGPEDIKKMTESRLDTLRAVNHLDKDYRFSEDFTQACRQYFLEGEQDTVLALEGEKVVGCATMCYITMMPTFSHPTGKRAHLMNVYTDPEMRRQGIARNMVTMLIGAAWQKGATEISLDATEAGRPLYRSLGFRDSAECMVLERSGAGEV